MSKDNTKSVITTSREKSHLLLTDLFKSQFGELSNFDKTSFNSWIIERLTDIQRDLAITMTLEKEEQFLNTCKNISTARTIGYNYNFTKYNVNPAKGLLSMQLILPYGLKDKVISLKADEVRFYAGDICYMLPGDIDISINSVGSIQAVRRNEKVFNPGDNVILYSGMKVNEDKTELVFAFSTEVIQLDYIDNFFIVADHSEMTQSINELEFDDSFYKIELWYEYYDKEKTKKVKVVLSEVNDFINENNKSEVYKVEITDEGKLNIILGDGINGKYYGSGKQINYRIYTTKGSKGNTIDPDLQVGTGIDLTDIPTYANFLNNPIGGRDEYNLLELKDAIRKQIQTPGTIITDTDLKNNISDILDLTSEETFHKLRRNDPIERILELFVIVKDRESSSNKVIPTNTVDIEVDTSTIIDNNYNTIKPFFVVETSISEDESGKKVRTNKIVPSYKSKNEKNMYYSTYYAIKLQKNPLMVNFFNLNANYNLSCEKTYVNANFNEEVYINSAILERDIFNTSNQYFIRLTLDSLNSNFLENNNLIIKARFLNKNSEKEYEDFILDFEKVKLADGSLDHYSYEAKITSLDVISDNNNLFIKDVYKKEKEYIDGTEDWSINTREFDTEILDSLDCELCIFYNYDTVETISNVHFKNIRGIRNKLLMTTYKFYNINFYRNVDEVVYCQALFNESDKDIIEIKAVPLYEESFINNYENKSILNSQMSVENSIKSKISEKTEFPSRLSLKYFNTYGYSDVYSSLDNVSLKIEFEVSYKNNKVIADSEILEIKNNLIKFIDTINKKDVSEDKNIYLSDLVTIVKNNSNIVQCRVLNYNDNIYFKKEALDNFNYVPTSLQLSPENIIFNIKSIN